MQSASTNADTASGAAILRILREGNKETFAAAKDAIMQQVLLATVQEALEDLGGPDALARQAFQYLEEEHPALSNAVPLLKEQVIEAVARRSVDELADAEATAHQARRHIDEEHEAVVTAKNLLKMHLVDEIAQRSLDELADAEAATREARTRIDDTHATMVGAVAELTQRLIAEIADRSTEALDDPEATARQARALIDPEHAVLLQAVDQLKDQLLETIVQESLAKINHEVGQGESAPPAPSKKERSSRARAKNAAPREPIAQTLETPDPSPTTPQMMRKMVANGYLIDEASPPVPAADEEVSPEATPSLHYYVHGILEGRGLELTDVLAEIDTDPQQDLYVVPYKSLSAIVSSAPGTTSGDADSAHGHLQNRVLEQLNTAGYIVLPMYTSTVYPNKASLVAGLAAHVETLHDVLATLAGKQEWNIKIYCDLENVQESIYSSNASIDSFLGQFLASVEAWSTQGGAAELKALQDGLDAPTDDIVKTILNHCESRVHRTLCALAVDDYVAPASEDAVFGNSRMVLYASYLVTEEQGEAFRSMLEQLKTDYEEIGVVYYIGGPHPPCHFTSPLAPLL